MKRRSAIIATLASVATIAVATPASADVTCTGTLGATTIRDDLDVPRGATCILEGTTVTGDVDVEHGARLTATDADLRGDVGDDDAATTVQLARTRVGGDVELDDSSEVTLDGVTVTGSVEIEDARGPVSVRGSDIGRQLELVDNRGGVELRDNRVGRALRCRGNDPAPTGGGNHVEGAVDRACAPLVSRSGGGSSFSDVGSGSVHADAIEWLARDGITRGCAPDRFCPSDDVSRAQMATFLQRGFDLPEGSPARFRDVEPSSVHAPGIGALVASGITQGCTADRFCPSDDVTRGQIASFLARALDLPDGDASRFRDVGRSVHAGAIGAIADAGITRGCATDRFCPDEDVTRAQFASLLRAALT